MRDWLSVSKQVWNEPHGFERRRFHIVGEGYEYEVFCSPDELDSFYDWLTARDNNGE